MKTQEDNTNSSDCLRISMTRIPKVDFNTFVTWSYFKIYSLCMLELLNHLKRKYISTEIYIYRDAVTNLWKFKRVAQLLVQYMSSPFSFLTAELRPTNVRELVCVISNEEGKNTFWILLNPRPITPSSVCPKSNVWHSSCKTAPRVVEKHAPSVPLQPKGNNRVFKIRTIVLKKYN